MNDDKESKTQTPTEKQNEISPEAHNTDSNFSQQQELGSQTNQPKSKIKLIVGLLVIVAVVTALIFGLSNLAESDNKQPSTSSDTSKNLAEIIKGLEVDVPALNANLRRQEKINTDYNNTKVIYYRDSPYFVSGLYADPTYSIFFEYYNFEGVKEDQGVPEQNLIVNELIKNGFQKDNDHAGQASTNEISGYTLYKNNEFTCQVIDGIAGAIDIGLACIANSKIPEQLSIIKEYYDVIVNPETEKDGRKDIIYQRALRKDSATTGYKIGTIWAQVPNGTGGAYHLYSGKDNVWRILEPKNNVLQDESIACEDFSGNSEAKLAYKGESCFNPDGSTTEVTE